MNEPRMGDNVGAPFAEDIPDRLELDYGELLITANEIISAANDLPLTVENSDDVSAIASVVVKLRDLSARAEAHRVAEKEPFLRAGDAVHAFFSRRLKEPLDGKRRDLSARLDAYKQKQLAEERRRREAEAAAARKAQLEAIRLAQEAEAAARRARSAETIDARKAEAQRAKVEADMAEAEAEKTVLATMAGSTAMVGERFEGERSGQVGMRKVPVVFIEDVALIDLEALRPHLKEEHLLLALRAWAKATNYSLAMPGAIVALRDTTVVR